VCTDMWEGYVNAAKEFATAHREVTLRVVVDRFHVAKNYREGVDQLRKQVRRRLKRDLSAAAYAEIKDVMWPLRKNNQNLTSVERAKLRRLFEYAPELKLAYTLREELTALFNRRLSKAQARLRLTAWQEKVRRSGLTCFDNFLKTLDHWLDEITNYFVDRLSSGFVEGLNNKVKTLKRRCYGIFRISQLFQRLYLDLEGYRRFA
jgi:transposase